MGVAELEMIAPMLVAIVMILTIGGVVLLRPLSKRLGSLLEAMVQEKQQPRLSDDLDHVRDLLETMNGRLALLEERQDFTEALLADPVEVVVHLDGGQGAVHEDEGHQKYQPEHGCILQDQALPVLHRM